MTKSIWAIVVAAGHGTRFGSLKQFAVLGGQSVVARAVSAVSHGAEGVVVVVPQDTARAGDPAASCGIDMSTLPPPMKLLVVAGGATRAASVRAGLAAVPAGCDVIVVHDAARPLAPRMLCEAVVAAVRNGADGAVPGAPVADTVKRVAGNEIVETVDRDTLVRVQTPQAFTAAVLREAHSGAPEATDDAALVEARGGRIVVVPGPVHNVKITSPEDLALAEWWLARLDGTLR